MSTNELEEIMDHQQTKVNFDDAVRKLRSAYPDADISVCGLTVRMANPLSKMAIQ